MRACPSHKRNLLNKIEGQPIDRQSAVAMAVAISRQNHDKRICKCWEYGEYVVLCDLCSSKRHLWAFDCPTV